MNTAQDQQSRAEFETFWRKEMNVEAMDLARTNYPMTPPEKQQYLCHETNRSWITWQAARALPARGVDTMLDTPAGMEPVAFIQPLALAALQNPRYSLVQHQVTLRATKHEPEGVGLYTAAQVQAMGRVPPGWQAVPQEPTTEMVDAAAEAHMPFGDMALAIQSSIAAAPRPPAAQVPNLSNSAELARQPLSIQRINELEAEAGLDHYELVRLVERAHGIKAAP